MPPAATTRSSTAAAVSPGSPPSTRVRDGFSRIAAATWRERLVPAHRLELAAGAAALRPVVAVRVIGALDGGLARFAQSRPLLIG